VSSTNLSRPKITLSYQGGLKGKSGPNGRISVSKRPKRIAPTKRTKASRVTDFNIHVRSTLPQDVPPSHICNGPTYKRLCTISAGKGTDHSGVGRCKTHESRTSMTVRKQAEGLEAVKSRYGGGAPTNLKKAYDEMLSDKGLMSVDEEMAASKAMLKAIMESIGEVDFSSDEGTDKALKFLKAFKDVTTLNLKYQEIQRKSDFIITLPQFMKIVKQIGAIVTEELEAVDPVVKTKLMRRLIAELDITGQSAMASEGAVDAPFDVEDGDEEEGTQEVKVL